MFEQDLKRMFEQDLKNVRTRSKKNVRTRSKKNVRTRSKKNVPKLNEKAESSKSLAQKKVENFGARFGAHERVTIEMLND